MKAGPATEATAIKAASLLLGYLRSELPKPKAAARGGEPVEDQIHQA